LPEEFYEHLLWDELQKMEFEEAAQAGLPCEGEGPPNWLRRYRQWRAEHSLEEE
jgi:hypothetical protein